MIVELTDEEIKELNIICEYLDSNNSDTRNLGITLYNKYADKFSSFIYNIRCHDLIGVTCTINMMCGNVKIIDTLYLYLAIEYIMYKGEVWKDDN